MRTIDKIKHIVLLSVIALCTVVGITSCEDDEDFNTVALHSFGPSPVLRGETIKIIGSNLQKVTKVIFPNEVEVSAFESQTDGTIIVTVPQDAIPGRIRIAYSGGEITSKSMLTFKEPITIESVTPMNVRAGDIITVKGDYVYNIATATFADGVVVEAEDFVSVSRKEIQIEVPKAAVTGKVEFSDGAEVPTLFETEEPLIVESATITGISSTKVDAGDVIKITGANLQLIESVVFPGEIDTFFEVNPEGTEITVTVPAETCSGAITLKQYSGVALTTDEIAFPTIAYTKIAPSKDVKAGDKITITGSLLNRVTKVNLPGGDVLDASSFSVNAAGTELSFTVPSSMVDGRITLIQNSNISIETDKVAMKKMGNVFWSGKVNLGNWATNLEIGSDKDASDWDAFSSTIKGPGKLTINFTEDATQGWWQIKPVYRSDWNTAIGGLADNIIQMEAGQSSVTLTISQADVDMLYSNGWAFSGCNLTIESMEWEGEGGSAAGGTVLWEGDNAFNNWENGLQIVSWNADVYEKFKSTITAPGKLTINFVQDSSSTWWQLKPTYGDWSTGFENASGIIETASGDTSYVIEITQKDIDNLASQGWVFSGCFMTIKSIVWN